MDKVSDFKGIHEGKRLFILASGPSLGDLDLTCLRRRMVMGLNRSALAYADTHYHCTMDQRLFDLYEEQLKKTRFLFTVDGRPWGIPIKQLGAEGFSWDLEEGIYTGYTISYYALQLAVYMGFQEIYYVGLDLQHRDGHTHFFGYDFHSRNHEDTEFPRMIRLLEQGAHLVRGKGIKICNCSPVSTLKNFQKVAFDAAVAL